MVRFAGSKEKTVFAPTRVTVWSSATNSARELGPVRNTSGTLKVSFTAAGKVDLSAAEIIFTSLTISVNFDCFKSIACDEKQGRTQTANSGKVLDNFINEIQFLIGQNKPIFRSQINFL